MQPIGEVPDTDSEAAAEPTIVEDDTLYDVDVNELPAARTEAPDITDTGAQWQQRFPGESQGMPEAESLRLSAVRVTQVSDRLVIGSVVLGADTEPFLLVPGHRDRLRVTIQIGFDGENEAQAYIGSDRNISPALSGWTAQQSIVGAIIGYELTPIVLATKAPIYATTVGGNSDSAIRIQWAAELVAE